MNCSAFSGTSFRVLAATKHLFIALALVVMTVGAWAQDDAVGAIVVGDRVLFSLRSAVGSISPLERAGIVNHRLERVLASSTLRPEAIHVSEDSDGTSIELPGLVLLRVTANDAQAENVEPQELAQRWALLLRDSLSAAKPLYRTGEHEEGISFAPLLLVSGLAFVVPLLAARFRRVRVPVVVGEILLGIVIGRSGFDWIRYDSWLQFLAEFGFAYLMFLAGLEVDTTVLRASAQSDKKPRLNPIALGFGILALTLVLALGVSLSLTRAGLIRQPWLMMLVLSTTSLGLVVPTLKERGLGMTPFGQAILVAALVADFVTMFLITVVAGWLSSGPTLQLFLGLGLLVVFVLAVRVGTALKNASWPARLFEGVSSATAQIAVRGSLCLMLGFVALSATLGTEVILGAFLAGVLLALFVKNEASDLRHKLEALGFGFFIPIFFVMVGARFDLSALTGSVQGMILAPLLAIGAFAIKLVASLPFRLVASWREVFAGGFLMSSRLSLIIAAAEIGKRLGLFSEPVYAALIAVALATAVLGPLGFQLMLPDASDAKSADVDPVVQTEAASKVSAVTRINLRS